MRFSRNDVANNYLVQAIEARLSRSAQQRKREFKADFSSIQPLLKLGLTPRATETLLWLSQGKTNSGLAKILGISESTVKEHVQEIFEKLGVETRGAATARALEVLSSLSPYLALDCENNLWVFRPTLRLRFRGTTFLPVRHTHAKANLIRLER